MRIDEVWHTDLVQQSALSAPVINLCTVELLNPTRSVSGTELFVVFGEGDAGQLVIQPKPMISSHLEQWP